ncbi:MAG: T9SS type A sorting domain-containing protein [Candidatus Eisenbacteria bacterium]
MNHGNASIRSARWCCRWTGLGLVLVLTSPALPPIAPASAQSPSANNTGVSLSPRPGHLVGPGSGLELSWKLANHSGIALQLTVEFSPSRAWPFPPRFPRLDLAPGDSANLLVTATVPDTVAEGEFRVLARVHVDGDTMTLDACSNTVRIRRTPTAGVPVEVAPDLVRLAWDTPLRWNDRGIVEQQIDGGGWFPNGAVVADVHGTCIFEDRAAKPGSTAEYRLHATFDGVSMLTAPTTVHIPERTPLAIAGLHPNPARVTPVLAFTLSQRAATRLEIFDLAGRLVWRRDLGVLAPGSHRQPAEGFIAPRSGVYLFRITNGARSVSSRGVVTR